MEQCLAAVFDAPGQPVRLQSFPVPADVPAGGALCRVLMSTICGSDLHTVHGRRQEPTPLILGHEIIGETVLLGDGLSQDGNGEPLAVGERVSWTIMASCGSCWYCRHQLPQKCTALAKYGHRCCLDEPPLTGGFAQYIQLLPGTTLFKVPAELPDAVATPANCALSTVMNAVETIGVEAGMSVLIQGAGMLGLNLIAVCRQLGADMIVISEVDAGRRVMARRFGADLCVNPAETDTQTVADLVRSKTGGRGVDRAFEVCGRADAVNQAVECLRTGGGYLLAGMVSPGNQLNLEGEKLTRKCLTLRGIHNYRPEHLGRALAFLRDHAGALPYDELVGRVYPLEQIRDALRDAASGSSIRTGVAP